MTKAVDQLFSWFWAVQVSWCELYLLHFLPFLGRIFGPVKFATFSWLYFACRNVIIQQQHTLGLLTMYNYVVSFTCFAGGKKLFSNHCSSPIFAGQNHPQLPEIPILACDIPVFVVLTSRILLVTSNLFWVVRTFWRVQPWEASKIPLLEPFRLHKKHFHW